MPSRSPSALDFLAKHKHERLVVFADAATGLRGAIALHSTKRGPALGGTRLRHYASTEEGVLDVVRLAEAMTYKAAVAGLPLGGGKAVLFADGKEDDPEIRTARLLAYGRVLEDLGGTYITAEDANTSVADMVTLRRVTKHAVGIPVEMGGSGDPSPVTAVGVLAGIKALAEEVLHTASLAGVAVAVQGLGKVGMALAGLLVAEGARVTASDVNAAAVARAKQSLGIVVVAPEAIFDVKCAIFAPCAYGGAINDETLPRLTCQIVAGSANNQLQDERHGEALHARGIAYAVDYVINAGGLINVAQELAPGGYDEVRARTKTAEIYGTIKRLLETSRRKDISTERAAHQLALNALRASAKAPVAAAAQPAHA
jgi:leucine dehydrogenase